jgi:hypothetical protein
MLCVCARASVELLTQHAIRKRHFVIYDLSVSTILFSTLFHNRHDFRKTVIEHKMCVLIFCTNLSEKFLILRRTERDVIKNVYWSTCKLPVNLVKFSWNWNFPHRFLYKYLQISNLMKIRPLGPELFHANRKYGQTDGRTDGHDEANSRFSQFCDRP